MKLERKVFLNEEKQKEAETIKGNNTIPSPTTSHERKLAKLGEKSSLLLQGFGLLLVLSGVDFFLRKRRKVH
ncbi:hypothetical protein AB441_11550 [Listeria monocytogenes]|nr:hypothetical protein [Listeria monocytogenes]